MVSSVSLIIVICTVTTFVDGILEHQYAGDKDGVLYNGFLGPVAGISSVRRHARQNYQEGKHSQNNRVRFAWQNPILMAPTLRPPQSYSSAPPQFYPTSPPHSYRPRPTSRRTTTERDRDPLLTSESEKYEYQKRPEMMPNAQAQVGRQKCSNGQRRDKQTGECINLGSPCAENMAFYGEPIEREYGQCDCNQTTNRPLVYHRESGKCYFIFQQAFCKQFEWLIVDKRSGGQPICSVNPCHQWTANVVPNWNWTDNGMGLDRRGTVGLLNERTCAFLGWPCRQEGNEQIASILFTSLPELEQSETRSLGFEGSDLQCRSDQEGFQSSQIDGLNRERILICKPGLFNKWRLNGRC